MGLKWKPETQKIERVPSEMLDDAIKTRNFMIQTWIHAAVMGVVLSCFIGFRAKQNLNWVLLETCVTLGVGSVVHIWIEYLIFNGAGIKNRIVAKPKSG